MTQGRAADFAWRFFDLGEQRLALTSPFWRRARVRPAAELAKAFHAMPAESPYPRADGGEGRPPAGGLALFEDACSVDGGILVAAGGGIVAESFGRAAEQPRFGPFRRERDGGISVRIPPLRQMKRLSGDFIFLRQPGDGDYGCWLVETLPRIAIAAQFCDLSEFRIVVSGAPGAMAGIMRDSLGLFGVRPERIVAIGEEPVFFQRLVFPLPVAGLPPVKSQSAMEVLEFLPARFAQSEASPLRIFVRGGLAAKDEAALVDLLARRDFAVVDPRPMSFAERAQAFARAEWIVGADDEALANAAFAPRGLNLVRFRDGDEPFLRDLAEVKQGRFLAVGADAADLANVLDC